MKRNSELSGGSPLSAAELAIAKRLAELERTADAARDAGAGTCGCVFSDAWRCARHQNLIDQVACCCACHHWLRAL